MKRKQALLGLDRKKLSFIKEIGRLAAQERMFAYCVGGFVRDLILNKSNLDLDIVLQGDAVALAKVLEKKKKAQVIIYHRFKTATCRFPNGIRMDLATARKESYAHPGALPDVVAGSIHDDLCRRDFTINAMAVSIHPDTFGFLVDDFAGKEDLKCKKIRILHSQSFIDDPTRILRAVRFEQRLNFSLEKETAALLNEAVKKKMLKRVTLPRYFEEFKKILKEPRPTKYLKRCDALGIPQSLGIGLKLKPSVLKVCRSCEKNIEWYKKHISKEDRVQAWLIFFMAIVQKERPQKVTKMLSAFHCKKEEKKKISSLRQLTKIASQLSRRKMQPSEIYRSLKPLSLEVIIYLRASKKGLQLYKSIAIFLRTLRFIKLTINGSDLKQLGAQSGREVGRLLEQLLFAKMDGKVKKRSQEIAMACLWLKKRDGRV